MIDDWGEDMSMTTERYVFSAPSSKTRTSNDSVVTAGKHFMLCGNPYTQVEQLGQAARRSRSQDWGSRSHPRRILNGLCSARPHVALRRRP